MKAWRNLLWLVLVAGFVFASPAAYAKKEGHKPAGWSKGEKKGWGGKDAPPGLSKKDAEKAKKEAEKETKQAKKKADKKAKEAKKKAKGLTE